jgi:hypothetical protein
MSYNERPDGYKGVKYGAGAMAVLGIGFALKTCTGFLGGLPPATPESAERVMLNDPESGAVFATIKRTYPQEFEGLKKEIAGRGAEFQNNEAIAAGARSYMMQATLRHFHELAQAPHAALAAYRQTELAAIDSLKGENVAACATYFRSGQVNGLGATASDDLKQRFRDFQIKTWESEAAGRDTPAGRKIAAPDRATVTTLDKALLAAGFDAATISSAVNGGRVPDTTQCGVGLAFLHAIEDLPDDKADNFTAFVASSPAMKAPS